MKPSRDVPLIIMVATFFLLFFLGQSFWTIVVGVLFLGYVAWYMFATKDKEDTDITY